MRALMLAAVCSLAGCATQLELAGPYSSRLSQTDIQEIRALISSDSDVSHVRTTLDAVRPDEVRVTTRGFGKSQGAWTSDPASAIFTAVKRHGRWIATGTAEGERTITVY
jgi:hypothetical protein